MIKYEYNINGDFKTPLSANVYGTNEIRNKRVIEMNILIDLLSLFAPNDCDFGWWGALNKYEKNKLKISTTNLEYNKLAFDFKVL